ncbi:hypothetical protein FB45DRAFT_899091 [Roridomyces roridus]|uniref:Uncharacterized protein n=1 Tax=Roridomyces roridus TaxID=1738132 RepID=A0AAD7CCM3_9AGAR|nr:hypothetical protein FB45DRAFT_899091 [Roridomyces roridus]
MSASALTRCIAFSAVQTITTHVLDRTNSSTPAGDTQILLESAQQQAASWSFPDLSTALSGHRRALMDSGSSHQLIQAIHKTLTSFRFESLHGLLNYVEISAKLQRIPHEFDVTFEMLQGVVGVMEHADARNQVKTTLHRILTTSHLPHEDLGPEVNQLDIILDILFSLLHRAGDWLDDDPFLGETMALYAARREPGPGRQRGLSQCHPDTLETLLTKYLTFGVRTDMALNAIWRLSVVGPPFIVFNQQTLFLRQSLVIAVIKSNIMHKNRHLPVEDLNQLMRSLRICDTSATPGIGRWNSANLLIFLDFLEQMKAMLSSWGVPTLEFLAQRCSEDEPIPIVYQRRFAWWYLGLMEHYGYDIKSLEGIFWAVETWLKRVNAAQNFNDPEARGTLRHAISMFSSNEGGHLPYNAKMWTDLLSSASADNENPVEAGSSRVFGTQST